VAVAVAVAVAAVVVVVVVAAVAVGAGAVAAAAVGVVNPLIPTSQDIDGQFEHLFLHTVHTVCYAQFVR